MIQDSLKCFNCVCRCCVYAFYLLCLRWFPSLQVCIRSCPLYYPGAIGFATINGEPRVGELLDKAWSITEKCRFKILEKELDDVKQQTQETKNGETEKMEEDEKDDGDTEKQEKEAVVGKSMQNSL